MQFKKSKYGVSNTESGKKRRTDIDGVVYASIAEREYSEYLKINGISARLQPSFVLQNSFSSLYGKMREIRYVSDFQIGKYVIDVKGFENPEFKIKKKMFLKMFPELVLILAKKSGKNFLHYEYKIKKGDEINFFEMIKNDI